MTDVLSRPTRARTDADPAAPTSGTVLAGAISATTSAGLGLLVITLAVLVLWSGDGRSGSTSADALRTAGQAWFLAHHGSLTVPGGSFGLAPLGLMVLPALLLVRAGGSAVRNCGAAGLRDVGGVVAAVTASYGLLVAVVGGVSGTDAVEPVTPRGVLGGALLAAVAAGWGAVRAAGVRRELAALLPTRARSVLAGTATGVATVVAAAALLVAGLLTVHAGAAADLHDVMAPGLLAGLGLAVVQLAFVPNLVIWASAYVAGPGFAVGTGTDVSPFGVALAQVPGMPMLAATPGEVPRPVALALLAIPLIAGTLAGATVVRREPALSGRLAAAWGAAAGGGMAVAMTVLAAVAGGPVGGGRLTAVGPSPWQVGLAIAAETVPLAAASAWWVQRRVRP